MSDDDRTTPVPTRLLEELLYYRAQIDRGDSVRDVLKRRTVLIWDLERAALHHGLEPRKPDDTRTSR